MKTPNFCLTALTEKAFDIAKAGHTKHLRKVSGEPYIGHPVAVAAIVYNAGGSQPQVAAALCHDMKEDCEPRFSKEVDELGFDVGNIVLSCSEKKLDSFGKKRSWMDRKQSYLLCMSNPVHVQDNALLVIAADKLHNVSDTIEGLQRFGKESLKAFGAGAFEIGWYYSSMLHALKARLSSIDHDEANKLKDVLYLLDEKTRTLLRMLAPITADHFDSLDNSDRNTRRTVDEMDGVMVGNVFKHLYAEPVNDSDSLGMFKRILPDLAEADNYSICIKYILGVCFCEVTTANTMLLERGRDSIEVFRRLWLKLEFGPHAIYELERIEQYGSNAIIHENEIPF